MKHVLFIYVGLPLGGIETLLVRLAEGLSLRGLRISVLLATRRGSPTLVARLAAAARIGYLDEFLSPVGKRLPDMPLLRMCQAVDGDRLRHWLGGVPDFCHAADTGAVLLAARLSSTADLGPLTIGVYHDREYLFEDPLTQPINVDMARWIREAPPGNLLFFNESSVETHARRFGLDKQALRVCPIGVDLTRFGQQLLGRQSDKIVSIGRLTPFKTYNRVMLDVISSFRDRGITMRYEVWGDGDWQPWLTQRIAELGIGDLVTLKGSLPYEAMEQALEGSLAFVGSGTALIEASAAGVPAIAAIENEPGDSTYGCLHDFTGLSYHDAALPLPITTFAARILALRALQPGEYMRECIAAKQRARDFSLQLTLDRFEALTWGATAYRPRAGRARAAIWLGAIAATKTAERMSRRSPFLHRHSTSP